MVFFRHIALLDGIHVPEPVQITEGVRLIPLPFGELPEELKQCLPGFLDGKLWSFTNTYR